MRPDYCPAVNEPCQSMCDKPCGTKHSALDHLCELLAILHGDGGHYLDAHGMNKAAADAKALYYAKLTEADAKNAAMLERVRVLREALDHTEKTIVRQLALISERAASGNYLDKRPVVQSLQAHASRCRTALEKTK